MKNKIKKIEIENEIVYLKSGILGYTVVYPIKNKDGTINWKNLLAGGSWLKLFFVVGLCAIIILAIFEYVWNLKYCASIINNMT